MSHGIRRSMGDSETQAAEAYFTAPFGVHKPNMLQRALIWTARHSFLHRGRGRHRMTQLIMSLGTPMDIERYGCRFRIEGINNLIEYGLLLHPDYNRPEIEFLIEGLSETGVAVDIGCNIGLYSIPLAGATAPSGGRVISIDANPAMVKKLSLNAQLSGFDNVTALHTAVGDINGMVSLQIRLDDAAIVNVVDDAEGTVPMRRLDDILADKGVTSVDVLKIDVEGHEDLALAPYLRAASDAMLPDRIVIERWSTDKDYPECSKEFERLGYKLIGKTRSNSMYQRVRA